jgi:MtrB/PioB family decaheme-associated outer membrane protein
VQPESRIEIGLGRSSPYDAKANEWSGLKRGSEGFGMAGFELAGGDAYDGPGTRRWRLSGNDLGTDARSLSLENGEQGRYSLRLGYDELRRNASDSYRTPYLGGGSNTLTLPSNWLVPVVPRLSTTALNARGLSSDVTASNGIVAGVSTPPTAAQLSQAAAVQAADLAAFRGVDLYTQRSRFSFGWDHELDARWSLSLAFASEHKEGLKAQTVHADSPAETSTVLPFPILSDDDRLKLGLSYTGESLQVQVGYDASVFANAVPFVQWTMFSLPGSATTGNTATISNGAPSNFFHKVSANASYSLSKGSKLIGYASHAQTWQNESFPTDASSRGTMAAGYVLPRASAEARVVNEAAGLKFVNRDIKNLSLSAGVKYDLRENRTPVNTYVYYDNNTSPAAALSPFSGLYGNPTGLGTNVNINDNTPYSKRVLQGELLGTYQLGHGDHLKLAFEGGKADRYCLGSWISCANATRATENSLSGAWHGHLGEAFAASLSLSGAKRTVDYNELAFLARVPMANKSPSTATGALAGSTAYSTLVALGMTSAYGRSLGLSPAPAAGSAEAFYFTPAGTSNFNNPLQQLYYGNRNRMVEENGLRTYDQADRDRNRARASVTWQASEALAVQAGGEWTDDRYGQSRYGLQKSTSSALNFDISYNDGRNFSVSVFASLEDQKSRVSGNSIQTGVNSTAANVNGATAISGAGACNTTIATRNANYKIDPCLDWAMDAHDRTTTLGATLTRSRLFQGLLDVSASAIYSRGHSDNDVQGAFYVNNPYAGITGAPTKDIAAYFIPATGFPTNTAQSLELRLSGTYHLSETQALRLGYAMKRLSSADWAYEGMQPGALVVNLPTFESAPNYRVHTLAASYIFTFR